MINKMFSFPSARADDPPVGLVTSSAIDGTGFFNVGPSPPSELGDPFPSDNLPQFCFVVVLEG